MKIKPLHTSEIDAFLSYCKEQRHTLDDSFLVDEELAQFVVNAENPTYIAVDEKEQIIGTASLLVNEYLKRGNRSRFRIFHAASQEAYEGLFQAILPHAKGLDKLFLFVPEHNQTLRQAVEALSFEIERYAYGLERTTAEVSTPVIPEEYTLKTFAFGQDEADYCTVRNAGFAKLSGSETPITPEEVAKTRQREDTIEGGTFLLYHNKKPVGLIRTYKEEHNGAPHLGIGPLAIIPSYQGKGLGRQLLRVALSFGHTIGLQNALLSVNAENEHATKLYMDEGFTKAIAFICYQKQL
ncbi:GNAT family N-acetyltransferase [Ectobacillus sp. JY-23]|uniref:GNAT family N-acetyltransferase n=1 Tax=Ectobacillus sp. JY-23 TaxID=2933872 RepID=UPI001FF1C282|nr:GNAT family N-acetyltransferase [Ectobacillus sp. JY-23]UOY93138.1 GNAT family N-acetyltransferase [Ectobacillus sp. JY-23]